MKFKLRYLIIFTLVCLFAFVIVMVMMIKENGKCVDDPFGYSAMRLKESGGNYLCSCESLDPELLDFSFSEDGIRILSANSYIQSSPMIYENFDFSEIEVVN